MKEALEARTDEEMEGYIYRFNNRRDVLHIKIGVLMEDLGLLGVNCDDLYAEIDKASAHARETNALQFKCGTYTGPELLRERDKEAKDSGDRALDSKIYAAFRDESGLKKRFDEAREREAEWHRRQIANEAKRGKILRSRSPPKDFMAFYSGPKVIYDAVTPKEASRTSLPGNDEVIELIGIEA